MKKAYNETWVENLAIQKAAENWFHKNLISKAQFDNIKTHFPEDFYRPGIFVKIGLFLFACMASAFFTGFMSLFIIDAANNVFSIVSIICSACFLFFLERLIITRRLFHSGVDNALLYAGLGTALTPVFLLFEHLQIWLYCIIVLVVLVMAVYRYADIYVSAVAFITVFILLTNLLMKFESGKALLPFAIMLVAYLVYFMVRENENSYYTACQHVTEVLSLITVYLGGNYYVVREGNALLSDVKVFISPQIPFAPVFYFLTLIIPLFYIYLGLKTKDRILLLTGLFALAFSVFTYRYYFEFLTVSQGLTVLGMLMILIAVFLIRYFKVPKFGLTDEPENENQLPELEGILAAQYTGQTSHENGLEFKGGDFSGAGAGMDY